MEGSVLSRSCKDRNHICLLAIISAPARLGSRVHQGAASLALQPQMKINVGEYRRKAMRMLELHGTVAEKRIATRPLVTACESGLTCVWREVLNSEAVIYSGGYVGNAGMVETLKQGAVPEISPIEPSLVAVFLAP